MEFLLCNVDLGDYDVDDIVDIKPDGFNWGTEELASDRFRLIRIPDGELDDLATTRVQYLNPVYYCEECEVYLNPNDVAAHVLFAHSDDPIFAGVHISKNCKWQVSSGQIVEKKPEVGNESNLVEQNTKAVTVVEL